MMKVFPDDKAVSIDYETYYNSADKYSLVNMTAYQYVHDPRFDPYLVSVAEQGQKTYVGRPEGYDWTRLHDRILLAHNAGFDSVVTDRLIELGKIPELKNVQWQDTADMTAYLMVQRNLKTAVKYLLGRDISKAVRAAMDGRHFNDLNEQERADLLAYGGSDADECLEIWLKYSNEWPEIERRISCQNRDAVKRGFRINRSYTEESLKQLKTIQAEAEANLPWVQDGQKAGSLPALKAAVRNLGLIPPKSFKKDNPEFLAWQKTNAEKVTFLKDRIVAAGTVQHIARIETLLQSADEHDVIRPGLLYFGAATGRFAAGISDGSGAKNVNMLNLPRAPIFQGDPDIFDGKGIDLRAMYIPRDGYKFVIFDYSQIEARFSMWWCKETQALEDLKKEGNVYQAASVSMGWSKPGDKIKKTNPDLYHLAKAATLGLGYGMGPVKFVDNCISQGNPLKETPMNDWGELSPSLLFTIQNIARIKDPFDPANRKRVGQIVTAYKIVQDWRRANAQIVQSWNDYKMLFEKFAQQNESEFSFKLPSGRYKTYYEPKIATELTSRYDAEAGREVPAYRQVCQAVVVRGKPPKFLTGGNLLENIVQASCRDIMTYGAVEIEDKHPDWKFCWSCYDEVIFEVPESQVEQAVKEMPYIMTKGDNIRSWTKGLPLEVDGGVFDCYTK